MVKMELVTMELEERLIILFRIEPEISKLTSQAIKMDMKVKMMGQNL